MNPFISEQLQDRLLLASVSPRRREILENLGFEFGIFPTGVDEEDVPWDDPVAGAKHVAELKALEGARARPRATIIAADTIVLCRGVRMGKPDGEDNARTMLANLSGRSHEVVTGIALLSAPDIRIVEAESTRVFFRRLSAAEIERYIATGEPFGKAGAYAIQGHASVFVERIEGCYFNVVGLPVARLFAMFEKLSRARTAADGTEGNGR